MEHFIRVVYLDAALAGRIRGVPADIAGRVDVQLSRTRAELYRRMGLTPRPY